MAKNMKYATAHKAAAMASQTMAPFHFLVTEPFDGSPPIMTCLGSTLGQLRPPWPGWLRGEAFYRRKDGVLADRTIHPHAVQPLGWQHNEGR